MGRAVYAGSGSRAVRDCSLYSQTIARRVWTRLLVARISSARTYQICIRNTRKAPQPRWLAAERCRLPSLPAASAHSGRFSHCSMRHSAVDWRCRECRRRADLHIQQVVAAGELVVHNPGRLQPAVSCVESMHLGAALHALHVELEPPAAAGHARVNFARRGGRRSRRKEEGATSRSRRQRRSGSLSALDS